MTKEIGELVLDHCVRRDHVFSGVLSSLEILDEGEGRYTARVHVARSNEGFIKFLPHRFEYASPEMDAVMITFSYVVGEA